MALHESLSQDHVLGDRPEEYWIGNLQQKID